MGTNHIRFIAVGAFAGLVLAGTQSLQAGLGPKLPRLRAIPNTAKEQAVAPTYTAVPAAADNLLADYDAAGAAMRSGRFDQAKSSLDNIVAELGSIKANDPTAKAARSRFKAESVKAFRGEPHERALAYLYRGILYWQDGELDNAAACFRSGQIQDSDAEKNEFKGDYVLLDYLEGALMVRQSKDVSKGQESYDRGKAALQTYLKCEGVETKATLQFPAECGPDQNVIVFAEFGSGPTKVADGKHKERLCYVPGSSAVTGIRLEVADQQVEIRPSEDMTYQAITRGGRVMDQVLANKAKFKEATDSAGNTALATGATVAYAGAAAGSKEAALAGAGLAVLGGVSKGLSAATKPAADTRMWSGMPQFLAFGTLKLPPGEHNILVTFLGDNGTAMTTKNLKISVDDAAKDKVLFVSDKPAT